MAQRKRLPALPKLDNDEGGLNNHIIQKSNPLYSLWSSDLTLTALKILDAYLARIDSHNPQRRKVEFEKGELENYLEVVKINKPDLNKRLDCLFQPVTIYDENNQNRFIKISLFDMADCNRSDDGFWYVSLNASDAAMEYIFNIDKIGYFKYQLKSIINLKSRYSYFLYLFLVQNRNYHLSWETKLDQLKKYLKCESARYAQFKFFNSEILRKCQKEINEKTDIKFSYELVKKRKTVIKIRFILEPCTYQIKENNDIVDKETETSKKEEIKTEKETFDRDDINYGFSDEIFDDFTYEQLEYLKSIAWAKKKDNDVERHNAVLNNWNDACQYALTDYLKRCIYLAKSKKAKNLFLYVKKIIEQDFEEN